MGGNSEFVISENLNVTVIKSYGFAYSRNITKLTLPSTLTRIEANAFYGIYTDTTNVTELELCYNGTVSEFTTNVTLEEGWNTDLTLKEGVIYCSGGNYTVETEDSE